MNALAEALAYAERGWSVLPLRCSPPAFRKDPDGLLLPHGYLEASSDPAQVEQWFARTPDRGIGLACKPSGIVALDIDPDRSGDDQLHELQHQLGELPDTPRSLSGGGGLHLLFDHPDVPALKARLTPGVEVKSAGYIVVPRSPHPNELRRYEWEVAPEEMPLASLPKPWLAAMTKQPRAYTARPGYRRDWLEEIPPVQYARDLAGVEPNRAGFIHCINPEHSLVTGKPDSRPSLKLYDDAEGGWCCHGCKRGGYIFQFAALLLGITQDPLRGVAFLAVEERVLDLYARMYGVEGA